MTILISVQNVSNEAKESKFCWGMTPLDPAERCHKYTIWHQKASFCFDGHFEGSVHFFASMDGLQINVFLHVFYRPP